MSTTKRRFQRGSPRETCACGALIYLNPCACPDQGFLRRNSTWGRRIYSWVNQTATPANSINDSAPTPARLWLRRRTAWVVSTSGMAPCPIMRRLNRLLVASANRMTSREASAPASVKGGTKRYPVHPVHAPVAFPARQAGHGQIMLEFFHCPSAQPHGKNHHCCAQASRRNDLCHDLSPHANEIGKPRQSPHGPSIGRGRTEHHATHCRRAGGTQAGKMNENRQNGGLPGT